MKLSILITTALFPLFTLAGGGGGLRPNMQMVSQDLNVARATPAEALYYLGHDGQSVHFAYAKWSGNSWDISKIEMSDDRLPKDGIIKEALELSEASREWTLLILD